MWRWWEHLKSLFTKHPLNKVYTVHLCHLWVSFHVSWHIRLDVFCCDYEFVFFNVCEIWVKIALTYCSQSEITWCWFLFFLRVSLCILLRILFIRPAPLFFTSTVLKATFLLRSLPCLTVWSITFFISLLCFSIFMFLCSKLSNHRFISRSRRGKQTLFLSLEIGLKPLRCLIWRRLRCSKILLFNPEFPDFVHHFLPSASFGSLWPALSSSALTGLTCVSRTLINRSVHGRCLSITRRSFLAGCTRWVGAASRAVRRAAGSTLDLVVCFFSQDCKSQSCLCQNCGELCSTCRQHDCQDVWVWKHSV